MATDVTWKTVASIANTAGITGFALTGVQGAIAYYRASISPNASLAKSERILIRVRSRLQGLTPQQREEIEIAARSVSSEFTSMEQLEKQLAGCVLLIDAVSLSNSNQLRKNLIS